MMRATLILMVLTANILSTVQSMQSYVYLNEKSIREELPVNSFVVNLKSEISAQNVFKSMDEVKDDQFTLLEDSKLSNGNVYFKLNSSSGELVTNQFIDRESMCENRLCADPCEASQAHIHHSNKASFNGSCRINLKVLMLPSSNILNLNLFIEDINDNRPLFRSKSITKKINENVPIGYKIPIELAYDPDIGMNNIQFYEILTHSNKIRGTFKLAQNLNDGQLHLAVIDKLDRELIADYKFTIAVYDGGQPALSNQIDVKIMIVDINDNSPIFENDFYEFKFLENLPIGSEIGRIKAGDFDSGLNGQIKYSFVDKSVIKKSINKNNQYFDLDENTGIIRLKKSVDYEKEKTFILTAEARDLGAGSLPVLATIEINLIDVNDNSPEISVSFLNMLHKNMSNGFTYDLFLPENTKTNKFLAHVNINDQDDGLNGKIDWIILLNKRELVNSSSDLNKQRNSMLKLVRLNDNSFTLNVGNSFLLDREKANKHNVSIIAWDHGQSKSPKTYFNFSIVLLDENDNVPKFDKESYEATIFENQPAGSIILKLKAFDLDSSEANSRISYSIREPFAEKYLTIADDGVLRSKVKFDREKQHDIIFNVVATDHGNPVSLSTSVRVSLTIIDQNDHAPVIFYNTTFVHMYNSIENTLWIKVGRDQLVNTKIAVFSAFDPDQNQNSKTEFEVFGKSTLPFRLESNGLFIKYPLTRAETLEMYSLRIICKDSGVPSLNTTLNVRIEVAETSEYCIETENINKASIFLNRDSILANEKQTTKRIVLFEPDFVLKSTTNSNSLKINTLKYELLDHSDLIDIKLHNRTFFSSENKVSLEVSIKPGLNISKLNIGKYKLNIKLTNKQSPSCGKFETLLVLIGNNFMNEREILTYIDSVEKSNTDKAYNPMKKSYKVKPATIFMKSDYILLAILIIIILVTVIFVIFIGVFCLCNKIKKKYSQSKKKTMYSLNKPDSGLDDMDIISSKKVFSQKKKIRMKQVDLNSSSTSNSSSSSKPQYLLVNNSSSSSSSSSNANGTLIYRDPDFDEFGLNPSSIQLVRHFSGNLDNNNKLDKFKSLQNYQKQNNRYIYSSTINGKNDLNILNIYDSSNDRSSNSATNSIVESTTIDDSKSTSTNNDFEIMTPSNRPSHLFVKTPKLESYRANSQVVDQGCSLYTPIADSNPYSDIEQRKRLLESNHLACQDPISPTSYRSNIDTNTLLTFNRAGMKVIEKPVNTVNLPNSNNNRNINHSNYGTRTNVRTSFNL